MKINFFNKYKTATNSTFPKIIKIINDILVKLFKSTKLMLSTPYIDEEKVLVRVRIDNLKAFSNDRLSSVNILDKTNIDIIKEIKTKKAIFESSSVIFESMLNKFLLKIFIGLANL